MIGFVIGMFLGFLGGVVVVALCVMSGRGDDGRPD